MPKIKRIILLFLACICAGGGLKAAEKPLAEKEL
jgi:hypothetical protein